MNVSSSSYQNGINYSEPFRVHCTNHTEHFITIQWVKCRNQSLNGMVLPVAVAYFVFSHIVGLSFPFQSKLSSSKIKHAFDLRSCLLTNVRTDYLVKHFTILYYSQKNTVKLQRITYMSLKASSMIPYNLAWRL